MIIPDFIRVAFASLRSTRVRTALTTLGIIIGVFSIALVLALGEGAKQAVAGQVAKLDQGIIVAKPGADDQQAALSRYNPFAISPTSTLTERDVEAIKKQKTIENLAPIMFVNGSVTRGKDRSTEAPIIATSGDLESLLKLKLTSGEFINPNTNRNTVTLGHTAAINLIGTDQARGQEVQIKGRPHTVIGVLKPTETPINILGVHIDESVFINLDDGKTFNQGIAQIQQIIMRTSSDSQKIQRQVDNTLLASHDGERDFTVYRGEDAAETSSAFYGIIVLLTTIVAAISLVVGGIGIMNIMLVSVSERTREIGIRKALGATNSHVLLQFLIESLTMTILGGIIGLAIAYVAAFFIAAAFSFYPAFSWTIVGVSMGLALLTGLIFGIYPAFKAARKDPITSLRQYE